MIIINILLKNNINQKKFYNKNYLLKLRKRFLILTISYNLKNF